MTDYNRWLDEAGVTDKQRAWFLAWMVTMDSSAAAREAGYSDAGQCGWLCRHNPKLLPLINDVLEKRAMPGAEVIAHYTSIADGSMADFIMFDDELPVEERLKRTATAVLENGKTATVPVISDGKGYRLDLNKARKHGRLGNIKRYNETTKTYFDRGRGAWITEVQTTVELYSKTEALKQLGDMHGLWKGGDNNISFIKNEVIAILKTGAIDAGAAVQILGEDLANALFAEAGIPLPPIVDGG